MKLHSRFKSLCGAVLLGTTAAASVPAMANNEAMLDLLKALYENGQITAEQYELISNAAKADAEKAESAKAEAKQVAEEAAKKVDAKIAELPVIDTEGGLEISSADGDFAFAPIGRIFWDTIWEDDDGLGDGVINGGSELRRARLGFEAKFYKYWQAKLEFDFASDAEADLKDGWISYNNKFFNGDKYSLKVGQHHVPFGFNTISSSKYMSFLRRPLFADGPLSPARQYGFAFRLDGDRYLVHAGAFLPEPGDGDTNVDGDSEDMQTYALRIAGTPLMQDKTHLLHIGGSVMYMDPRGDTVRVSQRAITHVDKGKLFDTGSIDGAIDHIFAYDFEALGIYGPFHVLGEYVAWNMDNNGTDASFVGEDLSAWSVEGGFFLTGESMVYKKGQFSGVKPKRQFLRDGGLGAWQVVARYENMDLNDGGSYGGDGDIVSVGLNWNPIKNVRFMGTWNKLIDFNCGGCFADGAEPGAFSIRSLVYW